MVTVNLRAKRQSQRRTLEEQAALCGLNTSTVSRVEKGKQLPHLTNIRKMAEVYELDTLTFLSAILAQNANSNEVNANGVAGELSVRSNVEPAVGGSVAVGSCP